MSIILSGIEATRSIFNKHWDDIDIDNCNKLNITEVNIVIKNIFIDLSTTDRDNCIHSYVSNISSRIDCSYTQQLYLNDTLKTLFKRLATQTDAIISNLLIHIEHAHLDASHNAQSAGVQLDASDELTYNESKQSTRKHNLVKSRASTQSTNTNVIKSLSTIKLDHIQRTDLALLFSIWLENKIISFITVQLL